MALKSWIFVIKFSNTILSSLYHGNMRVCFKSASNLHGYLSDRKIKIIQIFIFLLQPNRSRAMQYRRWIFQSFGTASSSSSRIGDTH